MPADGSSLLAIIIPYCAITARWTKEEYSYSFYILEDQPGIYTGILSASLELCGIRAPYSRGCLHASINFSIYSNVLNLSTQKKKSCLLFALLRFLLCYLSGMYLYGSREDHHYFTYVHGNPKNKFKNWHNDSISCTEQNIIFGLKHLRQNCILVSSTNIRT